jgi:hypothetical protein
MLNTIAVYFVGLKKNDLELLPLMKSTLTLSHSKLQTNISKTITSFGEHIYEALLLIYVTINVKHSVQQLLLDFSNQASH